MKLKNYVFKLIMIVSISFCTFTLTSNEAAAATETFEAQEGIFNEQGCHNPKKGVLSESHLLICQDERRFECKGGYFIGLNGGGFKCVKKSLSGGDTSDPFAPVEDSGSANHDSYSHPFNILKHSDPSSSPLINK